MYQNKQRPRHCVTLAWRRLAFCTAIYRYVLEKEIIYLDRWCVCAKIHDNIVSYDKSWAPFSCTWCITSNLLDTGLSGHRMNDMTFPKKGYNYTIVDVVYLLTSVSKNFGSLMQTYTSHKSHIRNKRL